MRDHASADAPGRVNLIGEHTDYHDGYVLPTVIPQRTHVSLRRRPDHIVCAASTAISATSSEYALGQETRGRGWLDYLQGVTSRLTRQGVALPGLDIRIDSEVPVGAGVSSSAALEVSFLRALRTLLPLDVDDVDIAKLAHEAETEFVGAPVGIMDPMASSLGRDGEALFLDTRTLAVERLAIPSAIEIVVIDSGVAHAHADGAYRDRRRESFEAAAILGVNRLRDLDTTALPRIAGLPPTLARRARHVVTENARVLAAVTALRTGDARRLGALFAESQASMRDDYEISTPEIDALVAIAARHPAVDGARMTGGGFGGAVVVLAHAGEGRVAAQQIADQYWRETGRRATVLVPPVPAARAAAS
jgi:galactokinase